VCKECQSKRNKENAKKRNIFKKVRLNGLFADFMNNIPSETIIKNQEKKFLEQKQSKIKNHKNRYISYPSIRLPKDLLNEVKNYLDTHKEYLSIEDFIRETIRNKLLDDKKMENIEKKYDNMSFDELREECVNRGILEPKVTDVG